jgi:hypothetical protein
VKFCVEIDHTKSVLKEFFPHYDDDKLRKLSQVVTLIVRLVWEVPGSDLRQNTDCSH